VAWSFEHSADSAASAESVWRRYADVTEWSKWSPGVEWAELDGPFKVGSRGKSKPPGSMAAPYRLIRVNEPAGFASEVRLPGARLVFEHQIEPRDAGVRITHRATLSGPLSRLYERRVKSLTEQNLTDGVERLAATTGDES
jgi:polyketide cyclase/dehydrase/lipid transport protein